MPKPSRLIIFLFLTLGTSLSAMPVAEVRTDIEFLAGEVCEGRESGSAGAFVAAQYIRESFSSAGLAGARISSRTVKGRRPAVHNVIAPLPGKGRPVVVMARYDGLGRKDSLAWYPGADSNAGGVAAMLEIARRFSRVPESVRPDFVFAAVDAMTVGSDGADAIWDDLKSLGPRLVVSLDILGTDLAPVKVSWPQFLIALGGDRYRKGLEEEAEAQQIHLFYDYYGSGNFTRYFFVDRAPHRRFHESGTPCVLFTSGITEHTNKTTDTPATIDYGMLEKRISLIFNWLSRL